MALTARVQARTYALIWPDPSVEPSSSGSRVGPLASSCDGPILYDSRYLSPSLSTSCQQQRDDSRRKELTEHELRF